MNSVQMTDATSLGLGAIAVLILVAVLAIVVLWAWFKGRRVAASGDVFFASRLTRGNRLFPAQVVITPSAVTLVQPRWIGKQEESIHLAHVASIKINTHMMFSDVLIETSGGQDPVLCHGHTKGDAIRMKQLIEKYQTDYYKAAVREAQPRTPDPGPRTTL